MDIKILEINCCARCNNFAGGGGRDIDWCLLGKFEVFNRSDMPDKCPLPNKQEYKNAK